MRFMTVLPLLIAVGVLLGVMLTGPQAGYASSATVRFNPTPMNAPWNANNFSVDIRAENVAVTTQCPTDPDNPTSPTQPCGLGGFSVTVSWDPAKLSFVNALDGGFLGSTGRSVSCPTKTNTASSMTFSCVTLGPLPFGPQGSGTIAKLQLHPLVSAAGGTAALNIDSVTLVDIKGNTFPSPATDGSVQFDPCYANIAPSNTLIDFQDVLADLAHFGEQPPSNPKYDPTVDGKVTFNDVFYLLRLFGVSCTP
jgi:hypothetical protein